MRFGKALAAAVEDLKRQGADKSIVDLRGNIGGSLGFSMLASYSVPRPAADRLQRHTEKRPRRISGRRPCHWVPMPITKASLLATLAAYALRDKSVVLLTQGLGQPAVPRQDRGSDQ